MRIVVALGGNALLKRGEPLTAENQRRNMREAAGQIAAIAKGHELVLVHGNGPQVGLLALEADAYKDVPAYPLDILGAESQGMIGYVIAQELQAELTDHSIATLITRTEVDGDDPAFQSPTKPIGPVYTAAQAEELGAARGWAMVEEGKSGWRRVVASPLPREIVELPAISALLASGAMVICAGGGGVPVVPQDGGGLSGVEAVIDKDRAAALLAHRLKADRLVILTDVEGVFAHWGTPDQELITEINATEADGSGYAAGSMGPKVEAAAYFALVAGKTASIGSLSQALAVFDGSAGTHIVP
jgi:carbamate kinase